MERVRNWWWWRRRHGARISHITIDGVKVQVTMFDPPAEDVVELGEYEPDFELLAPN